MLKIQSDRVIIDGHEPTKEQCETMTLLANAIVESNNFKTVEYRDGYAEFEKVGKAECLKFAEEGTVIEVNSTTLDTTLHTAGKYCNKNILVKSSDSNLVAENIKKDVSIFGVTGSYAGGGAALAHTAKFTVDGSNYAIHSVTDGQPIVSPISPSKTGYAFKGWTDSNGNTISFPYTMSASEETLAASFIAAYYMTIDGLGNSSPTSQTYV